MWRGDCVFLCMPHVLIPLFSRAQARLAAVVSAHNGLKVNKQPPTIDLHILISLFLLRHCSFSLSVCLFLSFFLSKLDTFILLTDSHTGIAEETS